MKTVLKPVVLALACGLMLALMHQQTRGTIAANRDYHARAMLRELAPGFEITTERDHWRLTRDGGIGGTIHEITTREGYNGRMTFLVAVSAEDTILAARVSEHHETPGLGDRIENPAWMNQFSGLAASDNWLLSPRGRIDGLTGATITAKATARAIRHALPEADRNE